jgi:isoquinoline 1-oxidoreductase beta subunit
MKTPASEMRPTRRQFLKQSAAIGGGLTVGFSLPAWAADAPASSSPEINAWVVVRPDNTVRIRFARSEMGQGSSTAVPMMVAEELECDWQQVRMEYASATEQIRRDQVWGSMRTAGSSAIRLAHEAMRNAGASARIMLVTAAAERWKVSVSECGAALGYVIHRPSGRKLSYGRVAGAAGKLAPPKDVKLKDPKDWRIIGQSLARLDIPDAAMGRQRFGIDAQIPGMVYAAVVHSPVIGGALKSFDAAGLRGRRGFIKVVPIEGGVAVVANNWWRANQMAKDLPIEWSDGGNGSATTESIVNYLRAGLDQPDFATGRKIGDVEQALRSASKSIEAEYHTPFLAHATLEPQVCTARVQNGRVDVWASTQDAEEVLRFAAATAGVPLTNVEVHRLQTGGGFGRRAISQEYVRQVVAIAKDLEGTPVKMLWSREEDTQHDYYRAAALYRLRAALDENGNPIGWITRIAMPSLYATLMNLPLQDGIDRAAVEAFGNLPYAIPHQRVEYARRDTHIRPGFFRGVGQSQNPFARECFVDELAHAAGKDPYEFRRGLLAQQPKSLGVLDAVARAAAWDQPLPAGVFRGIATTEPYGSFAASVIEVSVNDAGELKIHRIITALDCGYVVNPDTTIAQTEGNAVFGLTAALYGEITVKDGRVQQSNFHDYRMLRLGEMPRVEVVLVPTGGFWGGAGEPGIAPIAPALCNAVFAATGKRIRSLPLKNHDFRKVSVSG